VEVFGKTTGLKPSELRKLERIYRRRVAPEEVTSRELAAFLGEVSAETGRQVGVLLHRSGGVDFVVVGDAARIDLPDIGRLRAGSGRFRGLRLVHTRLRAVLGVDLLTRDDLVDLVRLRLDLVATLGVDADGRPRTIEIAHPLPENDANEAYRRMGPMPFDRFELDFADTMRALEEEFARRARARPVRAKDGRAVLVQVLIGREAARAPEAMRELRELARTAGVDVVDEVVQRRDAVHPKWALGRGKLDEVVERAMQKDARVLVFDRNLSPAQADAIASVSDLKVIDRTQLILDIFAQRAESRDGKLQVDLAQMKYVLPRLGRSDDALSRLTGGIGGRGPGETKLEIGRRRVRERIADLEKRVERLSRERKQRRRLRERTGIPVVAIVGYTNAGKSTLLNTLTGADVLATDQLFATLDPRTRRLRFPEAREVLLTDTVGFIRDLPKDLMAAFRATFEEAGAADLLLHVIDVSDPAAEEQVKTTERLLGDLELDRIPRIVVVNKADLVSPAEAARWEHELSGVALSALAAESARPLLERIQEELWKRPVTWRRA